MSRLRSEEHVKSLLAVAALPSSGSRTLKLLALVFCALLVGSYFRVIFTTYRAARLPGSDLAQLTRAVELAPGSAEYHHRLGRYLFLVQRDPARAIEQYRASTEQNPRVATAWLDLAQAHQSLGQSAQQSHALERALTVDPRTPRVAWEAGQQYLAAGQTGTALQQFRIVVEHDPQTGPTAMDMAWQTTQDADLMLRYAIPPTATGRLAFLNYLVERKQGAAAALAWSEAIKLNQKFSPGLALPYVEFLLVDLPDPAAVVEVWKTLQKMDPEFPAYSGVNHIVNASFEQPTINAGLDWRARAVTGVSAAIDVNQEHAGSKSLGLVLDGTPLEELGVFQYLALQPNTRYQFSAYVRDESIAGAGGLRFEIIGARSNALYFASPRLPESDGWEVVRGSFTSPKDAGIALLRVAHTPAGQRFRGRFWIDDLELTPQ